MSKSVTLRHKKHPFEIAKSILN